MSNPGPPLAELFQAHRMGLAGAVRSVLGRECDVAGLLQDAFLKCWRAQQGGTVPDDPVAWIFVVTWNVAVDARRRGLRRPLHKSLSEDEAVLPTTDHPPSHALEQREEFEVAQAAIERLADPEKQVFLLRVSGGLTFEAVAQALAIPVGTAKTRMRSALQKVRQQLGVSALPVRAEVRDSERDAAKARRTSR
jgi:RNA polymerase sigma-70 factor (ECF subfamily)